jgi:hypothetical protein
MHKYQVSFHCGCTFEHLKRNYLQLKEDDKFTPDEILIVEKKIKKVEKRLKHVSFHSLSQLLKLKKKLDDLDQFIWFLSDVIKPFRELTN